LRVAVGSDHAGFGLKRQVLRVLAEEEAEWQDFGTYDTQSTDYPDVAKEVAQAVAAGRFDRGILLCGTGTGVSIAANKVKGIRAALCHDVFSARYSRLHNDANVLCFGGRVLGPGLMADLLKTWLQTPFSGEERHCRRVEKVRQMECGP
jgi:ribose 5-phosphate isomerase B